MTIGSATMRWIVAPFCLVIGVAMTGSACGGGGEKTQMPPPTPERSLVFDLPTSVPTATDAVPEATAAATPAPAPGFPVPAADAQLARLVIPAAKVDAPMQVKGVNARREMENPDGKDTVAWYNFSERPGYGGNAVFSGHVDWYTGERGVFWYLKDLKEGDEANLRLSDGMELKYRVTTSTIYKADTAPVAEIVGPLSEDTLTLITCEGVFNRGSQDYSDRRVVRAQRVG